MKGDIADVNRAHDQKPLEDKILSKKQEIVLNSFVDGETSWWQRFIIRKSLQKNFEARQYVDRIERNAQNFKQQFISESANESASGNLADRVINRISQEERLSLLRSLPSGYSATGSFLGKLFDYDWLGIHSATREKLAWGSLGAVCASLFILFFQANFLNSNNLEKQNMTQLASNDLRAVNVQNLDNNIADTNISENSRLVAFNKPIDYHNQYQRFGQVQSFPTESLILRKKYIAPQVVEVDWVRSNGRVKVLRDPNGKASILWVQKRQPFILKNNMQINPALNNANKIITAPAVEFVSNK